MSLANFGIHKALNNIEIWVEFRMHKWILEQFLLHRSFDSIGPLVLTTVLVHSGSLIYLLYHDV
jgi:hypothetical protein